MAFRRKIRRKPHEQEIPQFLNPIVREIRVLSDGTLANLFGTTNMSEIDEKAAKWQQWAAGSPAKFETWHDAWEAYKKTTEPPEQA